VIFDNEVGGSLSLEVIVPDETSYSWFLLDISLNVWSEKRGVPNFVETTFNLSSTVIADKIEISHRATDIFSWNGIKPRITIRSILSALSAMPFPFRSTPNPSPRALV
jgi:hypothetical protein